MKTFWLSFAVFIFVAHAFAQPPAQDLQDSLVADSLTADSLHADSLAKISLALDVDSDDADHTNEVDESIGARIRNTDHLVWDYFPEGFIVEFAYAAPAVVHLSFWRFRDVGGPNWMKKMESCSGSRHCLWRSAKVVFLMKEFYRCCCSFFAWNRAVLRW